MQTDFVQALRDLGREKDIPLETLSEIIEAALVSAYKKHYAASCEIHVDIEWDSGDATVFIRKRVTEHVENPHMEMALAEARRLDPTVQEDECLDIEVKPAAFGRIAAQTAKQVVAQRIREAEREIIFEEFSNRDGDVVTGVVQRREGRTVFVDVGKVEAVLPASEQSRLDSYRFGERMKVYILEVKRTTKTPRVLISRSHPGLLRRLFELEVPEVHEGIVEIKAQARETGARSKVAVISKQDNVDPVGACVGHRGSRVQAVVDELRGEKVDIVRWGDEPAKYVASALSPAKVTRVLIDEATRSATVVAPDNQLSLAIGREGQNVRLAARLTGWRIDIRSEVQMAEQAAAIEAAVAAEAGGIALAAEAEAPAAEDGVAEEAGAEETPAEAPADLQEATEAEAAEVVAEPQEVVEAEEEVAKAQEVVGAEDAVAEPQEEEVVEAEEEVAEPQEVVEAEEEVAEPQEATEPEEIVAEEPVSEEEPEDAEPEKAAGEAALEEPSPQPATAEAVSSEQDSRQIQEGE